MLTAQERLLVVISDASATSKPGVYLMGFHEALIFALEHVEEAAALRTEMESTMHEDVIAVATELARGLYTGPSDDMRN